MPDAHEPTDDGPARGAPLHARIGSPEDRCEVHHIAHGGHAHAGHGHGHGHERATDRRRLVAALCISGVILVAEVIGGLWSGSLALLSDAGHVLTDMSAQILSLLALLFAARPADARRTYGYYRLEILAALVNGAVLIALALLVMVSAYRRLYAPAEVDTDIMLPIAIAGLVGNLAGAWLLHRAHTLNVRGAYLHILSDTLASAAVVIGGLLMLWRDGLEIVDPILGLVIGLFVVVGAIRLLREATEVLLESVPSGIDLEKVRADVRGLDGIVDVHDLHIWTITSGLHALSAHIVVRKGTMAASNDEILTRVKELLLRRHRIAHSTLQIESTEYEHVGHVH